MNIELFQEAVKYYGVKEIPGKKHNPIIVEWTKRVFSWATDDEIAWCSTFLNAMAQDAGLVGSGKGNARSWLKVGTEVKEPVLGDVAIFWRVSPTDWRGHVAIFTGYSVDGKNLLVLGGNQGNQVNISKYPISRLLGFRRLEKAELI